MAETALLVPVPEAGAVVDHHRVRLTRAGTDGIPPHVTLLYPFTDSAVLTAERVLAVTEIVGATRAFDVSLASTGRFDVDPPILYLAPEPAAPFAALTRALLSAFPEHLPYDGRYPELVPHLTVAIADAATLASVEAEVGPALPIEARVEEAWLMQRDDGGRWRLRERLGARPLEPDVQVGGPAVDLDAPLEPVALELRLVADEVAGRDRAGRPQARSERADRLARRCSRARGRPRELVGRAGRRAERRRRRRSPRVALRRLDRLRVEVDPEHRREAELRRGDRQDARSRSRRRARCRAPPPRAARGRAASSGGRRCRTRGPDRSRPRRIRVRPLPRAGRSRGAPTR